MGNEGGFPLVSVFDTDIVVTPPDVKLGKDFSVPEFINGVRDQGKGVGVSNGVFV